MICFFSRHRTTYESANETQGLITKTHYHQKPNEPVYDMLALSFRRKSFFKHACATNNEAWFEPSSTLIDRVCEHLRLWIDCADWYVRLSLGNLSYICGFYIVRDGEEIAGCFALIVFLVPRVYCVVLPHDATGLSTVCDWGIS